MQTLRQELRRAYFYLVTIPNLFRLHEMAFLRNYLIINKDDRILDVACGIGVYADRLSKKSAYVVGFDLSYCLVEKYFTVETIRQELTESGFEIKAIRPLLNTLISVSLCKFAFRIMKWPYLLNIYSLATYPISFLSDIVFHGNKSRIIIGAYASKPVCKE